jgi:methylated-DNA-[protein]-cysteine S-methyltransferase
MFIQTIKNDWGEWTLLWNDDGIVQFGMEKWQGKEAVQAKELAGFAERLSDYLQGKPVQWTYPLALPKTTPFRRDVWRALQQIPYGQTKSYQQVAELCGSPRAARAVGQACSKNPVMILLPCHRVIGADGSMTGFGGGISLKEKLLALERKRCQTAR